MLAQEKAKIGRYEIIGLLGEGAMGTVYRAFDPLIERVIALKTIRLSTSRKEHDEFVARFYREAKSAGRLNHPNIVTIHDMGEADNLAYIAMEYLEGFSLRDMLDQRGRLPPHDALRIAVDVVEALAYAHECGVVHRDIKPANIHVMSDGSVKLTDFGIAHLIHVRETRAGMLLGSPLYMSPEQVKGQVPDGRTDIFSLGVVLYEMLTGQVPFAADNLATILYRVVNDSCPHASAIHQALPADLDPVLERAMAKDPTMRYPNAGAMSEAMNAWLHSHPNGIGPQLPPYAFMARRRRRQWRMAATITAPFLVLASIWALLWHQGPEPISSSATTNQVTDDGKQAETDGGTAPTDAVPPPLDSHPGTWASESKTGPNLLAQPELNKPNLPSTGEMTRLFPLEGKLNELKKKKTELLLRYTELHPEVLRLTRQIKRLEEQKAEEGF
jgi:eukaryotic-like serine/threonine-protein kinase